MSTEFFDQVLLAMHNRGGTATQQDGTVVIVTESHILERDLPPMPERKKV